MFKLFRKFDFSNLQYNEDYAFLLFVAVFTGILFLISGCNGLTSFLTGAFIYLFLRFCLFLWTIILRIIGLGRGGGPRV